MTDAVLERPLYTREHLDDAFAFWERGRIGYNVVLLVVTSGWLLIGSDNGARALQYVSADGWIMLGMLAACANLAYCAAYPVDLAGQNSSWRKSRAVWRTGLWLAGTAFAVGVASLALWPLSLLAAIGASAY